MTMNQLAPIIADRVRALIAAGGFTGTHAGFTGRPYALRALRALRAFTGTHAYFPFFAGAGVRRRPPRPAAIGH